MLDIIKVSKKFGTVSAVEEVSLTVYKSEFLTLLGPSGCGKTTLLNLVAGFFEPTSGKILISGRDMTHVPPHRRNTGMVFQNYALFPHMSVFDNIAFGLKMRRNRKEKIRDRVSRMLELVKLEGFDQRQVSQLSGGQQQRVALARALAFEPDILLLDEPLSSLDKNLRSHMRIELRQIQKRLNITTMFVTHDQGEALSMSDRIVVLNHGKIEQIAKPVDLYRKPATDFVAAFIGEINQIPAKMKGLLGEDAVITLSNGSVLVVKSSRSREYVEGQDVFLFVRPEDLKLLPSRAEVENAISGRIADHIYQGSHTQVRAEIEGLQAIDILVPGVDVIDRYPVGATVSIQIDVGNAILMAGA
jgi:spermidine/putrescine ABC transporter ATP-binding subunit